MTVSLDQDLDAAVRKADPDRWQAARFVADPARRAQLVALYALNDELARVAEQVSTPMIGDIRLAWWREGLEAVVAGGPVRAHPVLQALVPAADRLDMTALEAMTAARAADLEPAPFADEPALVAYIDGTAGALMAAGARGAKAAHAPPTPAKASGRRQRRSICAWEAHPGSIRRAGVRRPSRPRTAWRWRQAG